MQKAVGIFKQINSYYSSLLILGVGIITLLYDGKRYKEKGYLKEFQIIKVISYTYVLIGSIMFVLLIAM